MVRCFLVAQLVKNLPAMQETWLQSLGQEGNSNPLKYSCLENAMDMGTWQIPWGSKELDMSKQLTLSLFSAYY